MRLLRLHISEKLLFGAAERNTFRKKFLASDVQDDKRQHSHERGSAKKVIVGRAGKITNEFLQSDLKRPQSLGSVIEIKQGTAIIVVTAHKAEYELRNKRGFTKRNNNVEEYPPKSHTVYFRRLYYFIAYTVHIRAQEKNDICRTE